MKKQRAITKYRDPQNMQLPCYIALQRAISETLYTDLFSKTILCTISSAIFFSALYVQHNEKLLAKGKPKRKCQAKMRRLYFPGDPVIDVSRASKDIWYTPLGDRLVGRMHQPSKPLFHYLQVIIACKYACSSISPFLTQLKFCPQEPWLAT